MTKLVAATLALALVLVGCELPLTELPPTRPVIVTGSPANSTLMMGGNGHGGCIWVRNTGLLVADPNYGTAIRFMDSGGLPADAGIPVLWPPGFVGRRSGSEVEVLDPHGKAVAVTGKMYLTDGGWVDDREPTTAPGFTLYWPGLGVPSAWWACGDLLDPAAVRK